MLLYTAENTPRTVPRNQSSCLVVLYSIMEASEYLPREGQTWTCRRTSAVGLALHVAHVRRSPAKPEESTILGKAWSGVLGFSRPRFFLTETVAPHAISVSPPKLPPKKARDRDRKRGGALNVVRLRIVRSRWFVGPSSAESAAAAAPLSWERRGLCAVRAARRSSRDLPLRPRHSRKNPRDLFSYGSGSGRHNGCVKMNLASSHGRPARTPATHFPQ
jgi:hypothetical protein